MRHLRSICLLLALTTVAPLAHASEPPAAPLFDDGASTRADELTHKGTELAKKSRWAEAEKLFQQAWALKHSYDIGGNLGVTELALGKHRDAAEHLQFGLKTFPANGKPEHRDLVRDSLAKARAEVGALMIDVSIKGATVFIDGKEVGASPMVDEVFVDSGTRTIEAKLAGYTGAPQVVAVAKGTAQKVRLVLTVVPILVATAVPMTKSNPPPPKAPVRWPAAVTGGVGAVSLVAAIVFTAVSNGKRSDGETIRAQLIEKNGYCNSASGGFATQCEALQSASSSRDTFHDLAVGGYVLAGGAAAATVAILLMSGSTGSKKAGAVRVAPLVSSTSGGAIVGGSF